MVFAYWAHNKEGKKINFMSTDFADIGSTMIFRGEKVTIDDWSIDKPISVAEDHVEAKVEARLWHDF